MDIIRQIEETKAALESAQSESAAAQAELETVKGELATSIEAIESATAALESAKSESESFLAASELVKAELVAANEKIAKLESEAKTVSQLVLEITGSRGNKPAEAVHAGVKTSVSRAEFAEMSPHEQGKFCRSGGKISD